jgi:hypothetical protein
MHTTDINLYLFESVLACSCFFATTEKFDDSIKAITIAHHIYIYIYFTYIYKYIYYVGDGIGV